MKRSPGCGCCAGFETCPGNSASIECCCEYESSGLFDYRRDIRVTISGIGSNAYYDPSALNGDYVLICDPTGNNYDEIITTADSSTELYITYNGVYFGTTATMNVLLITTRETSPTSADRCIYRYAAKPEYGASGHPYCNAPFDIVEIEDVSYQSPVPLPAAGPGTAVDLAGVSVSVVLL